MQGSVYSSVAQVFLQFLNGPDRVVFPIAVALAAGTSLSAQVSDRYFINTRTREDSRGRLTKLLFSALLRTFAIYACLTVIYGIAAFFIVPLVAPQAISPSSYGLSGNELVYSKDMDSAPLTVFLQNDVASFIAASALWIGASAITFSLVAFSATLLIQKSVIALSVPMLIYIGQSAVYQIAGFPAGSFLISAIHPAGLQHYKILDSITPALVLFILALSACVILILTSRRNPRLS
jgi:hypothetical protein